MYLDIPFFRLELAKLIDSKEAKVCVVGLGYVGLPIAIRMAKVGFHVIGIDLNEAHIASLNVDKSSIDDVTPEELKEVKNNIVYLPVKENFADTTLTIISEIATADIFIICVPTPLKYGMEFGPHEEYLKKSAEIIHHIDTIFRKKHRLIIVESTTYPGCTEHVFDFPNDLFSKFHVAYSPERIDPGSKRRFEEINKVIGANSNIAYELAKKVYSPLFVTNNGKVPGVIINVGSIDAAETVKCAENGFRLVSISFANELARLSPRWGVDIWSIIRSIRTNSVKIDLPDLLSTPPLSEYVFNVKKMENMVKAWNEQIPLPNNHTISDLANLCFMDVASNDHQVTSNEELKRSIIHYYNILCRIFMYELSYFCKSYKGNISFSKVYEGIMSKSFGLDFCEPGPGAGGHCIPVDPVYLAHRAKKNGIQLRMIEEAYAINERMPLNILRIISNEIAHYSKVLKAARIIILGVTYKPNIPDLRESKALDLMNLLVAAGAQVFYCDPVFSRRQKDLYRRSNDYARRLVSLNQRIRPNPNQLETTEPYVIGEIEIHNFSDSKKIDSSKIDCAVLVTDHDDFKDEGFQSAILESSNLAIVDTRNVFNPANNDTGHSNLRVWGR
ncbi:MAG: UDP binding domain-containing protein [Candidatus Zixiibacteriota bacterium]